MSWTASTWRRITIALLLGTAAVWIGWDVILGSGGHETESQIIAQWARTWNVLPLLLGGLVSHWCWQNENPHYEWWPFAVAAVVVALVWDLLCHTWSVKGGEIHLLVPPHWTRNPGIWLGLGAPVGHFFWPQRYPKGS